MGSRLEAVGEAERADILLLDQVLGLGAVARQVDGEVVERVEVLESLLSELVICHDALGRRLEIEPASGKVGGAHLVLVGQLLEELADGLVEHGVLELRREVGERTQDERAFVHQEMRDVQVIRPADHAVIVQEDVDVERARLVALGFEGARPPRAPEPALDVLHVFEEGGRVEGGLDSDDTVEEPALLAVSALPGLPLPGLGPVQGRGVEEFDVGQAPEAYHRLAQEREAIAHIGAHREEDLRHSRCRLHSYLLSPRLAADLLSPRLRASPFSSNYPLSPRLRASPFSSNYPLSPRLRASPFSSNYPLSPRLRASPFSSNYPLSPRLRASPFSSNY